MAKGGLSLTFVVEDEKVRHMLTNASHALDKLVERVAVGFEKEIRGTAGAVSDRLGAPWEITGMGPHERSVVAPEWWAHFLAHGTREHGPRTADRLVFQIDGSVISVASVRGTKATHFDLKAVDKMKGRVDDILRQVIKEAT